MRKLLSYKAIGLLLILLLISSGQLYAQRWKLLRYQVGGGFGTTQIFGDIGGTASQENWFGIKDVKFTETRMVYGAYARYKINTLFSVKANFNYGSGQGEDVGSRNDRGRSYKAKFFEFSGQFEHYFLSEDARHGSAAMFNNRGMINNFSTVSAYTFAGLGATYSMLSHTRGVEYEYDSYKSSNVAPVLFIGIGAKYVIDDRWFIGAEFGYRWSFLSDYIEGYTQTESSKSNDVYYVLMFTANYRLKTTRRNIPEFIDGRFKKYGY